MGTIRRKYKATNKETVLNLDTSIVVKTLLQGSEKWNIIQQRGRITDTAEIKVCRSV